MSRTQLDDVAARICLSISGTVYQRYLLILMFRWESDPDLIRDVLRYADAEAAHVAARFDSDHGSLRTARDILYPVSNSSDI